MRIRSTSTHTYGYMKCMRWQTKRTRASNSSNIYLFLFVVYNSNFESIVIRAMRRFVHSFTWRRRKRHTHTHQKKKNNKRKKRKLESERVRESSRLWELFFEQIQRKKKQITETKMKEETAKSTTATISTANPMWKIVWKQTNQPNWTVVSTVTYNDACMGRSIWSYPPSHCSPAFIWCMYTRVCVETLCGCMYECVCARVLCTLFRVVTFCWFVRLLLCVAAAVDATSSCWCLLLLCLLCLPVRPCVRVCLYLVGCC